jgi:hypothetical protein
MLRSMVLAGGLVAGLSACAITAPPVEQVRAFASASEAFAAASQPLLDDVALAERERVRRLILDPPANAANVLVLPGRDGGPDRRILLDLPADGVLALASIGDPPATAAFRNGVAAVRHYASVLVLLAEGRNVEAARAELGLLATNLAGLAALLPTARAAPALVGPALGALRPLVEGAARAASAAELRRQALALGPRIKELTGELRAGAEPLFRALTGRQCQLILDGADPSAAVARIDAYRVAFADWLVLLGLVDQAIDQLVAAMSTPGELASLSGLTELSSRITTYAEGSKRALAAMRALRQP